MNKIFLSILLMLCSTVNAKTNLVEEKILYVDTVTYYGIKMNKSDSPFRRVHIRETSPIAELNSKVMYDFICDKNKIRTLDIISNSQVNVGQWRDVNRLSKEPIYMNYACENKTNFGTKYKGLNQCISQEMEKYGQCGSDSECISVASACQKFVPKNCYLSSFGVSCTKVPPNCTQSDIGTVNCPEFRKE